MDLITIPTVYIIACFSLGFGLWLKMLLIIESKGVTTNSLWMEWTHYSTFWNIISLEKHESKKTQYQCIFWIQLILIPLCINGFLALLSVNNYLTSYLATISM